MEDCQSVSAWCPPPFFLETLFLCKRVSLSILVIWLFQSLETNELSVCVYLPRRPPACRWCASGVCCHPRTPASGGVNPSGIIRDTYHYDSIKHSFSKWNCKFSVTEYLKHWRQMCQFSDATDLGLWCWHPCSRCRTRPGPVGSPQCPRCVWAPPSWATHTI